MDRKSDERDEHAGTMADHKGHGCELDPDLGRGDPLVDRTAAWPMLDVLAKLADAADILFDRHNYDGHGHEEIAAARDAARRHVDLMRKAEEISLSLPPADEDGVPRLSQKQADRFVEILTGDVNVFPEMRVVPMTGAAAAFDPPAPTPDKVVRDGFMRATKEIAEAGRWLTDRGVPERGTLRERFEVFAARRYDGAPLPGWLSPVQAALDSVRERVPESVFIGLSAVIKSAAREDASPHVIVDGKADRPGSGLYGRLTGEELRAAHAYAKGRSDAFEEAAGAVGCLPRGTWGDQRGERSPWPEAVAAIRALGVSPPRPAPMPPGEPEIEEAVGDVPVVVCGKSFTKPIGERRMR